VAGWATLLQGSGFAGLTWQNLVMFAVAGVLIYLAVTRNYEPLLLVPIGFGAILANLPGADLAASSTYATEGGKLPLLQLIYDAGISTELLPPLIFLGVGALTDFRPLLARPLTLILGAAAQLGIFVAALGATTSSASASARPPRSASSAAPTARPRSSSRPSWRRTCWAPWRSRRTPTWRWCP
jgi:carboxybiotin decarboxylase